ncbi:FtsK/SpoIIIE domain-containing protein [Nonomuraea insulae]
MVKQRRKLHRVQVEKAPRLGLIRPTPQGFIVTARLHDGQTPDDYEDVLEKLAHAWRVHGVRLVSWKPGRVTLSATLVDPLEMAAGLEVAAEGLLRVRVGLLDDGNPFVIDFRTVPHWLNVGATQSGKSNLANALIVGLSPQPVALVGFDLKGGVEFTPYQARLSALATERHECAGLLAELVAVIKSRMELCRQHRVKNIWHPRLPEGARPIPIVVLVDEMAELFLMADPDNEKEEVAAVATRLLRIAQLGRAFGIYLFVCGQRVGSDLGKGVTALRAQLTGRICHMVNDDETAKMCLGDMDRHAVAAARQIPPDRPGTAVVIGSDSRWHRARSAHVLEEEAEAAAEAYAHRAPSWQSLTAPFAGDAEQAAELDESEIEEFTEPDLEDLPV